MAKYSVTYSCGHTGTVELYGPGKERDRKLAWYRDVAVCPDCYKAQKADESRSLGLVDLTGSDKQIAWANDIRKAYMERMTQTMERLKVIDAAKAQDAWTTLLAIVNKATEAKWWIDNQYAIDKGLKAL